MDVLTHPAILRRTAAGNVPAEIQYDRKGLFTFQETIMNLGWKKTISIGFSVVTLFIGSISLTGCDIAGEAEQEEVKLEEGEKLEIEEE